MLLFFQTETDWRHSGWVLGIPDFGKAKPITFCGRLLWSGVLPQSEVALQLVQRHNGKLPPLDGWEGNGNIGSGWSEQFEFGIAILIDFAARRAKMISCVEILLPGGSISGSHGTLPPTDAIQNQFQHCQTRYHLTRHTLSSVSCHTKNTVAYRFPPLPGAPTVDSNL